MATLNISVPKLHCERKTDLFGADEVYVATIVTAGKLTDLNENGTLPQIVYAGVSPLNKGFKKSTIQALDLEKGNAKSISVDLGDAEAFAVAFALYEKDSGDVYESLQHTFTELPDLQNPTFSEILKELLEKIDGFSVDKLLDFLLGAIAIVFKKLKKDDLIGAESFAHAIDDPKIEFPKEFQDLRGMGGKYNIQLALKVE